MGILVVDWGRFLNGGLLEALGNSIPRALA